MEMQKAIQSELDSAQRILLVGHRDPDGDSAGSLLALAGALGDKQIYCYSHGRLPEHYMFLDPSKILHNSIRTDFMPDLLIAHECPSLDRMGDAMQMVGADTKIVNIDHHPDNAKYGHVNWIDTDAAALGEMMYALLKSWDRPITPQMSSQLYTAILTDTGRFQYPGTTARTLSICSELVERGADPALITRQIYFGLPMSHLRLMHAALHDMEPAADGRILAFTLKPEDFEAAGAAPGDAEGIIDLTQISNQVRIGLLFRESTDGKIKVSLRSRDSVNVGALAGSLGGGGHKNASGCTLSGTFQEVKDKVMAAATRLLENGN